MCECGWAGVVGLWERVFIPCFSLTMASVKTGDTVCCNTSGGIPESGVRM